jgi:hypothetical protein
MRRLFVDPVMNDSLYEALGGRAGLLCLFNLSRIKGKFDSNVCEVLSPYHSTGIMSSD